MVDIRTLSKSSAHHFFGYYGINPWDQSGTRHLSLEIDDDRSVPGYGEAARFGFIDINNGSFHELGTTCGWNLQQGCMAHWVQHNESELLSINDMIDDRCVTRIIDANGNEMKQFTSGLCALATDKAQAYGLDFARMYHCRKVVGYTNPFVQDSFTLRPDDNGIWHFAMHDDQSRLLVSINEIINRSSQRVPKDARCWINHVLPNPENSRLMFVCRYTDEESFSTSLWSMNSDGSNIIEEIPFGGSVSHFCWLDNEHLIVSCNRRGRASMRFVRLKAGTAELEDYGGETLYGDSHLCFTADGKRAVGDRYPDSSNEAELFLFNPVDNSKTVLGRFLHKALYRGDIRCDLHPRWSADGSCITFDSIHEGSRQIYLIENI